MHNLLRLLYCQLCLVSVQALSIKCKSLSLIILLFVTNHDAGKDTFLRKSNHKNVLDRVSKHTRDGNEQTNGCTFHSSSLSAISNFYSTELLTSIFLKPRQRTEVKSGWICKNQKSSFLIGRMDWHKEISKILFYFGDTALRAPPDYYEAGKRLGHNVR